MFIYKKYMGLITITSDWGTNDHYAAAVKAKIYGLLPSVDIIDVTHFVPLFDIGKAAYFIKNVYPYSPDGTVHIISVNAIAGKDRAHLIVCYQHQLFLGTDNGIFSLLFPEEPAEVYEITEMQDSDSFTFPSRDLFAKVSAALASGTPPNKLGKSTQIRNRITPSFPISRYGKDSNGKILYAEIVGEVTYIDRFENVNTNIHRSQFEQFRSQFTHFEISCIEPIHKISSAYSDVKEPDILALFASDGYLQIAINKGKAASLLGFKAQTPVVVRFENPKK
jgi:S-adenosylmethionine hydrolase